MPPKTRPIADRFWAKVQKSDGCWVWTACKSAAGYGVISIGGRFGGTVNAHRLSYELSIGEIPADLDVCHTCDNPACVRPDHLFLGTARDNLRDASRKGRTSRGSSRPLSRLNDQAVAVIKWARRKGTLQRTLAGVFGVSRQTISDIELGRRWVYLRTTD